MLSNEIIEEIMKERNIKRWEVIREYNEHMNDDGIDNGDYLTPGTGWESSNFDGAW